MSVGSGSSPRRTVVLRLFVLAVAAVGLYIVWPSLLADLNRLPELEHLEPGWFAVLIACEAASFACLWMLQRLMLRSTRWYAVATAQLTDNAVAKLLPGGTAAGEALQYRMLVTAGERPARVGVALAASGVVDVATVLALPILSLPFILLGSGVDPGLGKTAIVGIAILIVVVALMVPLVAYDRPLRAIGRLIAKFRPTVGPDLPDRLVNQRNEIRDVLSTRWWQAVLYAAGNWGFDYLALVTAVAAFDPGFPNPALILLAYVTGQVLSTISITPGGVGFVEAGLAATLVLAGVPRGSAALATLAYRLVSFWLALPAGGVAYWIWHRRYGSDSPRTPSRTSEETLDAAPEG